MKYAEALEDEGEKSIVRKAGESFYDRKRLKRAEDTLRY